MISRYGRRVLRWMKRHRDEWLTYADIQKKCRFEVDALSLKSLVDAEYIEQFLDPHDDIPSTDPDPFAEPPYAYRIREEGLGFLEDFKRQHIDTYINRALALAAIVISIIALLR